MLSTADDSARQTSRAVATTTSLPVRVEAREANNQTWRELTRLESVSETGALFYVTRLFETGRLLHLSLPLGNELRRYDRDAEQYAVWAIVRHCRHTLRNRFPVYEIDTAFIGAEPPVSYRKNPLTVYNLGELKTDGFYAVSENAQTPSRRTQRRYSIPIEIYIAVCDAQENIVAHEKTVTENISEGGASVFSTLDLKVGDRVRVIKQHGGFETNAVVRARRVGADNLPRLHLRFINARFPLDGIG